MPDVVATLAHGSLRVYIDGKMHLDIRRSSYRGLSSWKWRDGYKIEFNLADGAVVLVEYDDRKLWEAVLAAIDKVPINAD